MNNNNSFSFSVSNNLEVTHGMPLYVPPCDICHRYSVKDDADVQCVGWDTGESLGINEYSGDEMFADEWLCKQHREELNRPALTTYKKEDIGKRKVYVIPTMRDIEFEFGQ